MDMTRPKREATKVRSPLEPSDVDYPAGQLYVCMSFDQGGTTGWSIFGVYMECLRSDDYKILDNIEFWSAGELVGPETNQVEQMLTMAANWPDAHLLLEGFQLRQLTGGSEMLSPVRMEAAFRFGLARDAPDRQYIIQLPQLAMETMTDERLQAAGIWVPGKEHAVDAIRHNLTWLRRAKQIMTVRTSQFPRGQM